MDNIIVLERLSKKGDALSEQLQQMHYGEPICNYLFINDLATYGTNSYVYNTKSCLEQLLSSEAVKAHGIAKPLYEAACQLRGVSIGKLFKSLTNSDNTVFDTLNTMDAVTANETAMSIIFDSHAALDAITVNSVYFNSFCNGIASTELLKTRPDVLIYISKDTSLAKKLFDTQLSANAILETPLLVDTVSSNATLKVGLYSSPYGLNKLCKTEGAYKLGMFSKDYTTYLASALSDSTYWTKEVLGSVTGWGGVDTDPSGATSKDNSILDFNGFVYVESASANSDSRMYSTYLKHGYSGNIVNFATIYIGDSYSGTVQTSSHAFRCLTGITYYSDAWGENSKSISCSGVIKYTAR